MTTATEEVTFVFTCEAWAAISMIRSAASLPGASAVTRRKCIAYANAVGVPKHIQVSAHLGKSDDVIQSEMDQIVSVRRELVGMMGKRA